MKKGVEDTIRAGRAGRLLYMMAAHGSAGFCVNELTSARAGDGHANIFVFKMQVCCPSVGVCVFVCLSKWGTQCPCDLCPGQACEPPAVIDDKYCMDFSDIFSAVEPKVHGLGANFVPPCLC
jgi:hypothetical protein